MEIAAVDRHLSIAVDCRTAKEVAVINNELRPGSIPDRAGITRVASSKRAIYNMKQSIIVNRSIALIKRGARSDGAAAPNLKRTMRLFIMSTNGKVNGHTARCNRL